MLVPNLALAQVAQDSEAGELLRNVVAVVVNPIITLFFIMALSVFVFGIFEFILGADNDDRRSKGKRHMAWGIIGLFIMTAAFAIIALLSNLVGEFGTEPNLWIIR
jgi:hypothetical protein